MKRKIIYSILALIASFICSGNIMAQDDSNVSDQQKTIYSLLKGTQLPVQSGQFFVMPGYGLCIESRGTVYALDSLLCPEFDKIKLKHKIPYDKICFSGNRCYVKSQEMIFDISDEDLKFVVRFDSPNFNIFEEDSTHLNLVSYSDEGCAWTKMDTQTGKLENIASVSNIIKKIIPIGGSHLLLADGAICAEHSGKITAICKVEEPILDFIITDDVIMFCTPSYTYRYDLETEPELVFEGHFHSLYVDGEIIYLVSEEGNIFVIQ